MTLDTKYIVFLLLSVFAVAALMTLYKTIFYLVTKKTTCKVVNQIVAWAFSFVATVLCWWTIGVPDEFKKVFIYVFVVYVLQMKIDLNVLKNMVDSYLSKKGINTTTTTTK